MIVLAIDTALASCSVCVFDSAQNKFLGEARHFMERGHAEALPSMVARVMAASGLTYGDLNRVAVTTGPGTFTGIRVGLSFARALGLARGIDVIGIDSLTATKVAVPDPDLPVFVVHKAGNSSLVYFMNSNIIEASNAVPLPEGPALVIGTAAETAVVASGRADLRRSPEFDLPSASGFVAYAAAQATSLGKPEPLYLREADAKPQGAALRQLPELQILIANHTAIPALVKLHAACFADAWDEPAFTSLMASPGVAALLAISAEGPVGLLLYRVVADEAEILTIGVDPNLRRRGVGATLLANVLALKIPNIFLEVAKSNISAITFYQKAGFKQVGQRKAYYAATGDDGLIFKWSI